MTNAFDVATFILEKHGQLTAMKLQKLVYYSQAWSLVWDEEPLFEEKIEAWANGPVITALYEKHRGKFLVKAADFEGDKEALSERQKETILSVLSFYGDKTAQWLSDLTHSELPWLAARQMSGLNDGERGNAEITHSAMHEFYSAI